ncbi:hypothetical protein ABPG74_018868 [Tetrahymena malaccensis]
MDYYQSRIDLSGQNQQQQQQSIAYEFPIGKEGKKRDFIAGSPIKHDDNDLGEPSPVYLKNGTRNDRKCRDFICLVIFLFFIFYYILVFFEMLSADFQFERISVPYDPDHRPCGHKEYKEHKYLFFATPDSNYLYRTVCVKECPKKLPQDLTGYSLECLPNSVIPKCEYSPTKDPNQQFLIYETTEYYNSICLPVDKHFFEEISPALSINRVYAEVGNIIKILHIIILAAFLSFIFGLIFFGFLGQCGDLLTWVFIFSFVLFMALLGSVLFLRGSGSYIPIIENPENQEELVYIEKRISELRNFEPYFYATAFICWIASFTILGLVIYYHRKIKIIASQLKISAHFILQNQLILIVPFVLFIILLSFFIFWVYLNIQIVGTGVVKSTQNRMPFDQFEITKGQILKLLINLIFILIFRGVLVGCSDFLITSACSLWYYKKEKDNINTLKVSLERLFKYHLGSIVFLGTVSTILDYPIRLANLICDYLTNIKRKDKNDCAYYLASITLCGCLCFDKFLRYMNRYALIFISLAGDSYYDSSKQSYYLLKRHNRRFKLVRNLGGTFFTISKLFLALLSSLICYFVVISLPQYYQKVSDLLSPTLAFFILSYTTASFFIDVYSETSTSLILISYIDEEVEKYHYGKEDVYNCPHIIRGYLNSIRNARI